MLRNASHLKGFPLGARDGDIGRVKDFYFEDQSWTIRYLVADTGDWLPGRKVLIAPCAVRRVLDAPVQKLEMDLTKGQIETAPSIEENQPVSRQFELEFYRYYNWPFYWQGSAMWGPPPELAEVPGQTTGAPEQSWPPAGHPGPSEQSGDPHLRSTEATTGYYIQARDGEIGHLEDFVLDDADWVIKYLVVDTRNWWPGKKVLVSPAWATSMDWPQSKVHLDLEREVIKGAPEYNASKPITREYETRLFDYYHRPPYWTQRLAA